MPLDHRPNPRVLLLASLLHNAAYVIYLMPIFWSKLLTAYSEKKYLYLHGEKVRLSKFTQYRHFILYTVQIPSLVWVVVVLTNERGSDPVSNCSE